MTILTDGTNKKWSYPVAFLYSQTIDLACLPALTWRLGSSGWVIFEGIIGTSFRVLRDCKKLAKLKESEI